MLIRIRSHRARDRVERAIGAENVRSLFTFEEGHFYEVPDDKAEQALAIKSVGRARQPKGKLFRTWEMMT